MTSLNLKLRGYKPFLATPLSWGSIESHYLDLTVLGWHHEPFVELIKHIKSASYSARLFACTSLDRLWVSIYNPIELGREQLCIEFDIEKQFWKFTYYSIPNKRPTFVRQYPKDKGLEKFDNFIKMIRW